MNDDSAFSLPVAALMYHASSHGADQLLAGFARDLQAQGWRVHGLVQYEIVPAGGDRATRELLDLASGRRYALSQDLGPGSRACSLDTGALAAASQVLRHALQARADLVIVSRYGLAEAAGGGFVNEMLALMSAGIPVVTLVSASLAGDWRRFTGQAGAELPVSRPALQAWFDRCVARAPKAAQAQGAAP